MNRRLPDSRGSVLSGTRLAPPSGAAAPLPAPAEAESLEWLYWLTAGWCGVLMVVPYEPAKLLLYGAFWIALGWVLNNLPRYVPIMVVLGMPAMVFAPSSARTRIPLVNHHMFFLVALITAVYLIRKQSKEEPSPNPLKWPPVYLAVIITASAVVSYLTGAAQGHSWDTGWFQIGFFAMASTAKNLILFPFFAPIAFRLLSTPEHLRRTVHFAAIVGLVMSLQEIWNLRHVIFAGAIGPLTRAGGFVKEPNVFGAFLALTICVLFPLFLDGKLSQRERILFATTMGVAALALLSTLSRGSWLALIVAMGYLAFARGLKAMVAVLAIVMTATIWLPQSVIDRARETIRSGDPSIHEPFVEDELELDGSAGGRIEHWTALIDQWAAAPVFGHGFMSYGKLYGQIRVRTGRPVAAHSTIIEFTAEQGTLGLIGYIALIWMLSMGARGVLRQDKDGTLGEKQDPFLHSLALGLVAATICMVVLDGSGAPMKNSLVMTNVWFLAGGMARQYWNRKQIIRAAEIEEARQKTRRRKSKSRTPAGPPVRRPVQP